MLKRIYANNYRCLVNFELNLDRLTLLMGPNGGGKSSLFDLIYGIRRLIVDKAAVADAFPPTDLTANSGKTEQAFELDVQGPQGLYSYRLVITHKIDERKERIDHERLLLDGNPLFEFKMGDVRLYHDDYSPGPPYSFDWSVSGLAGVATGRSDNRKLTWFRQWIAKLFILSLQPKAMISEAAEESDWLNRDGTNFASWFRSLMQGHPDKVHELTEELHDVIPGLQVIWLEPAGKRRFLKIKFRDEGSDNGSFDLDFEQLSDGQRVMTVLYSLLVGLKDLGITVFLDEPENYVALPEIQPWLMKLNDACGEGFPQAVLISHHPELIDYLGAESGRWIERDALGPSRVKGLPQLTSPGLTLSELVARGWTD